MTTAWAVATRRWSIPGSTTSSRWRWRSWWPTCCGPPESPYPQRVRPSHHREDNGRATREHRTRLHILGSHRVEVAAEDVIADDLETCIVEFLGSIPVTLTDHVRYFQKFRSEGDHQLDRIPAQRLTLSTLGNHRALGHLIGVHPVGHFRFGADRFQFGHRLPFGGTDH